MSCILFLRRIAVPVAVLAVAALTSITAAAADAPDDHARFSDWGAPGLLQTPTARLPTAGSVFTGVSGLRGYHGHVFASLTPTPWLWLGARRSRYVNPWDLYEPGLDVAVRLWREGPHNPALTLGARDVTGSGDLLPGVGRFAGEYLALSRRWWSLDFSAGLGWGRLAGDRGLLPNPVIGRRHDRPLTGPGARGPQNWFSGDHVGLFGGLAWRTPLDGLTLMAEYSGDNLAVERRDDPTLPRPSPFNVGLSWRAPSEPYNMIELGAGLEQGRNLMLRVGLRFEPGQLSADRPPPPPPVPRPRSTASVDLQSALPPQLTRNSLPLFTHDGGEENETDLLVAGRRLGLPLRAVSRSADGGAIAWLDHPSHRPDPPGRDIGRTMRWLAGTAAPDARWLTVATRPQGFSGVAVTLPRERLLQAVAGRGSAEELWTVADIAPADTAGSPPGWDWLRRSLTASTRMAGEESLFEHTGVSTFRSFADLETVWTPTPGLTLGATLRRNVGNTLATLNSWAIPATRPVRSDLPDYAWGTTVERLYAALRHSPAADWHIGIDGGVLEEMFSGYGGEALYWPMESRLAAGLSLHRVWKRAPGLALRRIDPQQDVLTGHGTLYYQGEGGDWTLSGSLGRYLGGDWGGGVQFSRLISGETRLEAHATWTDGPYPTHALLGGRLEYGLRLAVPLGAVARLAADLTGQQYKEIMPMRLETAIRTLGRDAGQTLDRPLPLFQTLAPASYGRLTGAWRGLLE